MSASDVEEETTILSALGPVTSVSVDRGSDIKVTPSPDESKATFEDAFGGLSLRLRVFASRKNFVHWVLGIGQSSSARCSKPST